MTHTTVALSILSHHAVYANIGMTSRTMRFGGIGWGCTNSTIKIFLHCNRLKMRWIYTSPIATEMIQTQTIRN
jgi:hypothetical protein